MERTNKYKIAGLILLFVMLFIQVNYNIFQYQNETVIKRTFLSTSDPKGEYFLFQDKGLKSAEYTLRISGESQGSEDRLRIYGGEEILMEQLLPQGKFQEQMTLAIAPPLQNVSLSVSFDGDSGNLRIETVEIEAPFVLQKDVLLRHLVITLSLILLFSLLLFRSCRPIPYARLFGKLARPSTEFVLVFLVLLTLFTSAPFFNSDYVQTDDGYYHLLRIEGIKTSLEAGIFPAKIHLFILNDSGYGEGFYYPDLFLYFPALLRLLGFGILSAYKIFIYACSFFAIFSTYYAAGRIAKSRFAGLIAAVLLAFSSYRLIDIYYRGAVGEILSFIFIPWVVFGLHKIYTGQSKGWIPLTVGVSGLFFSHMISLALCGLTMVLFVLINIRKTFRDREILLSLIKSALMTILLSAIFWLPLLEQLRNNEVAGNVLYSGLFYPIDSAHLLSLQELTARFADWDKVKPFLGYPLLVIPLIRILLWHRKPFNAETIKIADWLLVFGVFAALAATDLFPWRYFAWIYNRIQFPWRALVIASPLLAMSGGILCAGFLKKQHKQAALLLVTGFCVLTAQPFFTEVSSRHMVSAYGFTLENNRIMGAEYLPHNANVAFIDKNVNNVICGDDSFENLRFKRSGLQFSLDFRIDPAAGQQTTFEIPLLYYFGYQGTLTDPFGNRQDLPVYQGAHGLTAVDISGISEGNITVFYKNTSLQKLAAFISLCTLFVCVVYYLRGNVIKRN